MTVYSTGEFVRGQKPVSPNFVRLWVEDYDPLGYGRWTLDDAQGKTLDTYTGSAEFLIAGFRKYLPKWMTESSKKLVFDWSSGESLRIDLNHEGWIWRENIQPINISTNEPVNYTPAIIREDKYHVWMQVVRGFERCAICGNVMLSREELYGIEAKTLHAVAYGKELPDGREICSECVAAGRATFICVLCKQERTINLLVYEDHHECLCEICYGTVSARNWDDAMDEIDDRHRWDDE